MNSNLCNRLAVLVTLLAVSACAVGPDYVRPTMTLPNGYKETTGETTGWKIAEPLDQLNHGNWWELFSNEELNGLEEAVEVSNQNLRAAEARYRQAQAVVQVARAGLFPTLTGGATESRKHAPAVSGQGPGTTANQYTLSLQANWEVDLWGRLRRSVEAGMANAAASESDLEAARLSIRGEVAVNYFHLRALDTQLRLFDDTVAAYEKSLQLTRNRYATGVAARSDVVDAQTQLKSTQAQAIDLRVQRAQIEHAIALLIGKAPADFALPSAVLSSIVPMIPIDLPSTLLERRPDIAGAERRVAAANAQIGMAEAAFFPDLSLAATAGYQGALLAHLMSSPNLFWSLGPSVAQTIFNGGLTQAQIEQAKGTYDESVANYRQTVLTGFQEVEDNLVALHYLQHESAVQGEAVRFARESVALTINQYRSGIVSYLNVVTAQATALTNERTAVDIRNRQLAASVQLMQALGGGWRAKRI